MADLSLQASYDFWKSFKDPLVYRVIHNMCSMESFVLDGNPKVEEALLTLGKSLDSLNGKDIKPGDGVIPIVAHINTARGLKLLMELDMVSPGTASRIISTAEKNSREDPAAKLFIKRNTTFERLRIMGRVFAKDRMRIILEALN